jgi:exo-1,4-beta-D-glucosaminidase
VNRQSNLGPVYFVRGQMTDAGGKLLAENVYWQSETDDEIGPPENDRQFEAKLTQWADMSALNKMPTAQLNASATYEPAGAETRARIKLANHSTHIAFFVRAEITKDPGGAELLPIVYSDNYITIFPQETRTLDAAFASSLLANRRPRLTVEGYNLSRQLAEFEESPARKGP